MPVIHRTDARDRARTVVQNTLSNMQWRSQLRLHRRKRPPQIMQRPVFNRRYFINSPLAVAPAVKDAAVFAEGGSSKKSLGSLGQRYRM